MMERMMDRTLHMTRDDHYGRELHGALYGRKAGDYTTPHAGRGTLRARAAQDTGRGTGRWTGQDRTGPTRDVG